MPMISESMDPAKARTHFWYMFRLFARIGTVLFPNHISRSAVLFCAASVVVLHGIVTFSLPRLWHHAGMPSTALLYICLSWLATVWIVYEKLKTFLRFGQVSFTSPQLFFCSLAVVNVRKQVIPTDDVAFSVP
jgi:hypothetical protein